jgi:hypothetical protein
MQFMKYRYLIWFAAFLPGSCKTDHSTLNSAEIELVKDSVTVLTSNIAKDLFANGPVAWLNYFEDGPDFFMAADGVLAFKNYQAGKIFIEGTLVKSIRRIELHWSNLRIDPLTVRLASVGADFHEKLTDSAGAIVAADGYFTAIAAQTNSGWKLRNLHWSILKAR